MDDPLVAALAPVYKENKEVAEKIHDLINTQKELAAHGMSAEEMSEFASNRQEIQKERETFQTVKSDLAEVGAYAKAGNFAKAFEKMNLNVDAVEDFFVKRAWAKEEGRIDEFNNLIGRDDEKVRLMMENQRLQSEFQQAQSLQAKQTINEFETKLRQNPLMGQVDTLFGKSGKGEEEFTRIYASLPENERNLTGLNKAYKTWESEMKDVVTRFGGNIQKKATGEKVTRKKSLSPPSGKGGGKSPAPKRTIGEPRTEEEWLKKRYI